MKEYLRNLLYNLPATFLPMIIMVLLLTQFFLTFFVYLQGSNKYLVYLGWVVWAFGTMFGVLPILILGKHGEIPSRAKFLETTKLVKTGVYAIVRHPQYLAGILLHITLMLISQNEYVVLIGIVSIGLTYLDTLKADYYDRQKFGKAYRKYIKEVPRLNALYGLLLILFRNRE